MDVAQKVSDWICDEGNLATRAIVSTHAGDLGVVSSCRAAVGKYLDAVDTELDAKAAIGFGFTAGYSETGPVSVFATASVLSNLVDLAAGGQFDDLASMQRVRSQIDTLVDWLVKQQDDGWWYNRELSDLDLQAVQDPSNLSVRIFHTALAAGVLARVDMERADQACSAAIDVLSTVMTDAGALFGLSQSTWVVTPAVAEVYGIDSSEFRRHRNLLHQYGSDTSFTNMIMIARQLVFAGVRDDELLLRCHAETVTRFDDLSKFTPGTALAVMLVYDYVDGHLH